MITQLVGFTRILIGDGTLTSVVLDLSDDIKALTVLPDDPSAIYAVNLTGGDGTVSVVSSSLSGKKVTITFNEALPAPNPGTGTNQLEVQIQLLF